jgi:hypothetical protein
MLPPGMKIGLSTLIAISLLPGSLRGGISYWADSFIDLKLPPESREYCHIVRFPQGWKIKTPHEGDAKIDYRYADFEFRVEGLLGTWFLVGVFNPSAISGPYDATNRYRVNLSDPTAPVLPASNHDWDAATVLPFARKSIFTWWGGYPPARAAFGGIQYEWSGDRWLLEGDATRLSPDGTWLVLLSATKTKTHFPRPEYTVFFDVFNTADGKKRFTIQGTYNGIGNEPENTAGKAAWLTERYFIIPVGRLRDRCVVCEFASRREPRQKP